MHEAVFCEIFSRKQKDSGDFREIFLDLQFFDDFRENVLITKFSRKLNFS